MTIYLLRASHANEYELQNYFPLAKDFDIRVVTSQNPLTSISFPSTKIWSPSDLPPFPYRRQLLNRLIGGEQWLIGLESLVKKGDILHTAETYTPYTHQAVQLRKNSKITKLFCTCWETIPGNNEKFARLRSWKQEAYRYVDHFHTPTKKARQALIKEGVEANRITVIPYGVDLARFKPNIATVSPNLILTVARLEPEKGMELIDEVARLMPDQQFLVIGQGSYRFSSSIISLKSLSYTDMPQAYQQASVFFFPSLSTPGWEEQYGMALVEAMASGLPIVASTTGAIPEVVGEAGKLINPSVKDFRAALSSLITSPVARERLSKLAQNRAKDRYSHLDSASELAKLYNRL